MVLTQILAIYGAILSTALAVFSIFRYLRDQRYLIVSVDVLFDDIEEPYFEVWMMNAGASSISLREIWVGSGKKVPRLSVQGLGFTRHSPLRPISVIAETMTSSLKDEYGLDGSIITIDPGSARKFHFKKKALDEALNWHLQLQDEMRNTKADISDYWHMLEIRHSRSQHPFEVILKPRNTPWLPDDESFVPKWIESL